MCSESCVTLWKEVSISNHLAKFGGLRPCGSKDIADLVFHVTLQNHMINEPCDFMGGSSSLYIPILPSLVAISIVDVDIFIILVCHVISQYRVIIWPRDFMGRSHLRKVTIPPIFVAIGIVVVEI